MSTRENPAHAVAKRNAACQTCGARPGESCTNHRGGTVWPPHKARLGAPWPARTFVVTDEAFPIVAET